jgi:L-arabinose isomerase
MGSRFRLIVQDVTCVPPTQTMPNLPVARVMWQPQPSLEIGAECWILAGGAHHTVLSYGTDAETMRDWARIMGVEFVHIGNGTHPDDFERQVQVC